MEKHSKALSLIAGGIFFMLFAGIALGSIYQMKTAHGESVETYLRNFLQNIQYDTDKKAVFVNSLKENLICMGIIFAAGFFRAGFVFAAASVLRRGFVIGFTAAGFVKYFGIRGILVTVSMLPGTLLLVVSLLFFASVSAAFSFEKEKKRRKIILSYILLALLACAIMACASLAEGYVTTVFVKRLAGRIL